jgi:hypothetical protein
MKDQDLESKIREALDQKPRLPAEAELVLFSRADDLLAKRRDQIVCRQTAVQEASRKRAQRFLSLRRACLRVWDYLSVYPESPALATALATLVLTLMVVTGRSGPSRKLSYSELPDLPKTNDFAARYEAQWFAERQAYEREVEDAHQKTSGGT